MDLNSILDIHGSVHQRPIFKGEEDIHSPNLTCRSKVSKVDMHMSNVHHQNSFTVFLQTIFTSCSDRNAIPSATSRPIAMRSREVKFLLLP